MGFTEVKYLRPSDLHVRTMETTWGKGAQIRADEVRWAMLCPYSVIGPAPNVFGDGHESEGLIQKFRMKNALSPKGKLPPTVSDGADGNKIDCEVHLVQTFAILPSPVRYAL